MDINDKSFLLTNFKRLTESLTNRFTLTFTYLSDIKTSLNSLLNKTFSVRVINQPQGKDYSTNLNDVRDLLKSTISSLDKLYTKDPVLVENKQIDLSELSNKLTLVESAIKQIDIPTVNFKDVVSSLEKIRQQISAIPQPIIDIPEQKPVVIPSSFSINEGKEIIKAIGSLEKAMMAMSNHKDEKHSTKQTDKDMSKKHDEMIKVLEDIKRSLEIVQPVKFPESISINNFPPTKTPIPVTNFNLNPLRGLVHTSSTIASTSLSPLPGYGVLENRRSLIFQNKSTTVDAYIGGSDVTVGNGYLLEAGSVSPAVDSGPLQAWYVITSAGTADIRTIELANDSGR